MSLLLILAWAVPLVLAIPALHRRLPWSPALAAVPALCTALLVPVGTRIEIPWMLLGVSFGLDEIGRIFLLFTAVLWMVAGVYAGAAMRDDPHGGRFALFFLLAMAGNLWLIASQDLIGFYAGFTLMGIASYGLVIHQGDRRALRAGTVYLVLTLGAEVTLFTAFVLIAATAGSIRPTPEQLVGMSDLAIGLLVLGLAVKAGLVPLHIWLPLAHPAAPIAASAVLSGAMIKVAILGWLRFLPIGAVALPEWGLLFVFAGLATAFYAVPIGLVQSDPKVLLAYSSIAKMGLMAIVLGMLLLAPEFAPPITVGLALYAGHHALTKGGLFLGVGLRKSAPAQPWVMLGIAWLALSLAAVPLTSGAVAKHGIKPAFAGIDWVWFAVPALTTLATAWLMARLLWILWRLRPAPRRGLGWALIGWSILPVLVVVYPLLLGSPGDWLMDAGLIAVAAILALPVALLARAKPGATAAVIDAVPAGDVLVLVRPVLSAWRWAIVRALRAAERRIGGLRVQVSATLSGLVRRPLPDLERALGAWPLSGGLWLAIMGALIGLALTTAPGPAGVSPPAAPPPSAALGAPVPAPVPVAAPAAPSPSAGIAEPGPVPAPVHPTGIADTPSVCDPARSYLYRHLPSRASVELTRCVLVAGTPEQLDAPTLTGPLVRLIQRHLTDLGFDPGPADGRLGPLTRGAIRRFQEDQGLGATGAISFVLLDRLQHARQSAGGPPTGADADSGDP